MLVVSLSDFANNSQKYFNNLKKTPFCLVDSEGKAIAEIKAPKKTLFKTLQTFFSPKKRESGMLFKAHDGKRPDAPLRDLMQWDFIDKIELTHEMLFSDLDDLSDMNELSKKYAL